MTRDEVLSMPAGPQMDRLIAERIMTQPVTPGWWDRGGSSSAIRPYSADYGACGELILRMVSLGWTFMMDVETMRRGLGKPPLVSGGFHKLGRKRVTATGETYELVVARAALLTTFDAGEAP